MRTWGCYFLNLDVEKKRKGLSMRVGHRAHKSTSSPSSTLPPFLSQPILILLLARNLLLFHIVSVNVKKATGKKYPISVGALVLLPGNKGETGPTDLSTRIYFSFPAICILPFFISLYVFYSGLFTENQEYFCERLRHLYAIFK